MDSLNVARTWRTSATSPIGDDTRNVAAACAATGNIATTLAVAQAAMNLATTLLLFLAFMTLVLPCPPIKGEWGRVYVGKNAPGGVVSEVSRRGAFAGLEGRMNLGIAPQEHRPGPRVVPTRGPGRTYFFV
jgi:hypothetical protein